MPGVIDTIIEQARSGPGHAAVKDATRDLSYAELLDEAARHATGLAAQGVVEGDRVAIMMANSVDFVVSALACLWLGAIFVPLAPSDPDARRTSIIKDCSPRLVVVAGSDGSRAEGASLVVVELSTLRSEAALVPVTTTEPRSSYIIYTSGTTGTPKGVLIGDHAFAAALRSTVGALGLDRATRTLCVSPFHFDGSYATLFATLVAGGSVVIRSREELLFPRAFFNTVEREEITYTGFTPTYLRLLLSSPQLARLNDSSLDVIALGGEAGAAADLVALWNLAPRLRLFNRYGPTETTIAVTHAALSRETVADGTVSMGRPHAGVRFYLVEDGVVFDEPGRVGELYVGGVQLMEGYWGDVALSERVLLDDLVPRERVYRTGDLVYRTAEGEYVYVNRADRIVKRNGVRISLIELDETIRRVRGVRAAACVLFTDDDAPGIAAFVITDGSLSSEELVRGMQELLPDTMLPSPVAIVDHFPMTGSNKLDERRLLKDANLLPMTASIDRS